MIACATRKDPAAFSLSSRGSELMNVSITGKHIDVGAALQDHVRSRLTNGVAKYFSDAIEAHVVFSHEGPFYRTHVSIHVGKGIMTEAHGESSEIYESFNKAAEAAEKQLRRGKRRLRDHQP